MNNNGDIDRDFQVGSSSVKGIGNFHKTLPHDPNGEVDTAAFQKLVDAIRGDGSGFGKVSEGGDCTAKLTNPQAGLANDRLIGAPSSFTMPPAPEVLSDTTAAEMVELYWMAILRDYSFVDFSNPDNLVQTAAAEIDQCFQTAVAQGGLSREVDLPPSVTPENIFRLGLPGENIGPMLSQFWLRDVQFGTQKISQKINPYAPGQDYLENYEEWLHAQNTGRGADGSDYSSSNEFKLEYFERDGCNLVSRYISTLRDLARFVNKDALYQAYLNATLVMLSGGAKWTAGNPYEAGHFPREAGFGVLGGPHILALVPEIATRALEVVWYQKWQTHLRLRPEAYGGLLHVQEVGHKKKRAYGLPDWLVKTEAAKLIRKRCGGYLLPMAFTAGSPTHPSYGAGHATVAGACVTMLKAYFKTQEDNGTPILFKSLQERTNPHLVNDREDKCKNENSEDAIGLLISEPGKEPTDLDDEIAEQLTLEGELNKLASNVSMGRSMGGVHWRSDNTRSLILGEAIAARILADITVDANERPSFEFRTFSRKANGDPKEVRVTQGKIYVDGQFVEPTVSKL